MILISTYFVDSYEEAINQQIYLITLRVKCYFLGTSCNTGKFKYKSLLRRNINYKISYQDVNLKSSIMNIHNYFLVYSIIMLNSCKLNCEYYIRALLYDTFIISHTPIIFLMCIFITHRTKIFKRFLTDVEVPQYGVIVINFSFNYFSSSLLQVFFIELFILWQL